MNKYVVILAAGKGTRMKSKLYKVLHKVCGKTMVEHVVEAAKGTNPDKIITVVGNGAESVKDVLAGQSEFAFQEKQLGTGDAVLAANDLLEKLEGSTLVATGDTPLFTAETFNNLFKKHEESGNSATVLTAKAPNPFGYGRIIRDETGAFQEIVEQKDCTEDQAKTKEVNSGMYVFNTEALNAALSMLTNDNAQGEYYLTDTISLIKKTGLKVNAMPVGDVNEILGVNTPEQLAEAEKIMQARK